MKKLLTEWRKYLKEGGADGYTPEEVRQLVGPPSVYDAIPMGKLFSDEYPPMTLNYYINAKTFPDHKSEMDSEFEKQTGTLIISPSLNKEKWKNFSVQKLLALVYDLDVKGDGNEAIFIEKELSRQKGDVKLTITRDEQGKLNSTLENNPGNK